MTLPVPPTWHVAHDRTLTLDRPRIIGIVNVTPDSFSDGGTFNDPGDAVRFACELIDQGADAIDIGGESTRPGANRIGAPEQIRRVVPVINALRRRSETIISIDTTLAEVAEAALDAGADVINDVSAGMENPAVLDLAAAGGAGLILMHRLRPPDADSYSDRYDQPPKYNDVVTDVCAFLMQRADTATAAGVGRDAIVLDPGLGFGKTVEQNYELMARCGEIIERTGFPILAAASRKSFIGKVCRVEEPSQRVAGSVAAACLMYLNGARLFRAHDVAATREALAVAEAAGSAIVSC